MSQSLAHSASDLKQEAGTLPVLICFVDVERRYRFNDGAWLDWFGVPASSLAGKLVVDVIGEQRYRVVSPFIDLALAGKQVAFETMIPTTDGHLRHGQVVYVPQTGADGKVSGFYALVTDITEWKRSQQAEKDSQALYQSLVDHLPLCLTRKDRDGRVTFANRAFYQLSCKTADEVLGKTDFDFYPQELAAKYRNDDLRVMTLQETFRDIEAHRTPAGELRYAEVLKAPVHDASGQVVGVQVLFWDVTDRKRAEEQLQDSQALYRSLVNNLPMCILRKDRNGRITFANNEFYRYSGKTEEVTIGKTDFDFYPHELASKYQRDDLRVLEQGESFSDIEAHRTPEGVQKYVQVLKSPIHDAAGLVVGVQILFWDVSDRKLAEEQVRESMARKRAIFDAALDCIVVADQQRRIIDFNRAAEKAFGYRRDDVLGQNMDELLFPPETRQRTQQNRAQYESSLDEGSTIGTRMEATAIRMSGEQFDVEMAMQAIPLEGKIVIAVFLQDITARKRAQEELAAKNKDLETLLYVTSHDLREPLRSIESFARLVNDRYADKIDDKGKDFLRRITDGTKRLDRLIEDVLMLSRAQRTLDPIDGLSSADLVAEVLKQLEGKIDATQARIIVKDNLPTLHADRRWVRQAVYNLVANALKFTKPNERPDIEIVSYVPRPGELEGVGLEVLDRGTGVNPDDAERIFGLFQRAVGQQIEGTGAGLAIVQQVALRHGGNAWVRPRVGGGSEFVVCFGRV